MATRSSSRRPSEREIIAAAAVCVVLVAARAWLIRTQARSALSLLDCSAAERACPRGLPIGNLMREAAAQLA